MDIKSADISISNNNCNCNKLLRTADASSYSVTLLHLGSENSDGIDHSGARPLAREAIALLV